MLRQSQLEAAPDALNISSEQREKLELLRVSLRVAPIAGIALGLNLVGGTGLAAPGPAPPLGPRPGGGNRGPNRGDEGDGETQGLTPAELEMTLESLQSEVDRIGQNVDRVSQRLSVPPIRKQQYPPGAGGAKPLRRPLVFLNPLSRPSSKDPRSRVLLVSRA